MPVRVTPPRVATLVFAVASMSPSAWPGSRGAQAHSYGAPSTIFLEKAPPSCNACHQGGRTPRVTVRTSRSAMAAGERVVLTVTITTPNGRPGAAGFDLRASRPGTFLVGGPASSKTKIVSGANGWSEATHTLPKAGEPATFTALWMPAPDTAGLVMFIAWGNAVSANGKDGPARDRAAAGAAQVTVTGTPSPDATRTPPPH